MNSTRVPCQVRKARSVASLLTTALTTAFSALVPQSNQAAEPPLIAARSLNPVGRGTGFTKLGPETTGVSFTNLLTDARAAENQIRMGGSGVAIGDVDGDHLPDIYFCSISGDNRLYRNLGGFKFEDVTTRAGVGCHGQDSTGALFADVDGDGDLDLLVNGIGTGTRLFLNNGSGVFQESTDSGLARRFGSTSMAMADIDGDGTLDLYVANYRTTTIRSTGFDVLVVNGRRMLRPEDREQMYVTPEGFLREYGEVDLLYLNDGQGHFTPLSWTGGRFRDEAGNVLKSPPRDWGLSVMMRDFNGDGSPDIYVCNDYWSPDRLWLNDGRGNFRLAPRPALPNTSSFSMGIDAADINRDGVLDFVVLDMLSPLHSRRITQTVLFGLTPMEIGYQAERPQVDRNTLFLGRGDGTFAEIARYAGIHASDWSWCPIFMDVDLDGYEDLLVSNGYSRDTQDADAEARIRALGPLPREKVPGKVLMYPPLALPNHAYRNTHDSRFVDVSKEWGFAEVGFANGMACADLDGDGDLDVVINNLNGVAGIYRNDTANPRVSIRLNGRTPNNAGIGAHLTLRGGPVIQTQEIISGGRYMSADDPVRVFAAGHSPMELEVRWRSGLRSVITNVLANHSYEISEATATQASSPVKTQSRPLFEDVTLSLHGHRHVEEPFDDFELQPLLPRKLSQLGPGVGWVDIDGDGREDLVIGSGKGGELGVFLNQAGGAWTRTSVGGPVTRDQGALVGWQRDDGKMEVLLTSMNYEDGLTNGACVRGYVIGQEATERIPGQTWSAGPMLLSDLNGDGQLELVVGGRVRSGMWPEACPVLVYGRSGSGWVERYRLNQVGMVAGMASGDLDGDGKMELVCATEWGGIKILGLKNGNLEDLSANWSLGGSEGWWNGICLGDFDGDGKLDIAASNWGLNTIEQPFLSKGWRLYYGDLDQNGTMDLVEAYDPPEMNGKRVPWRSLESLGRGLPSVRDRFSSHKAYAAASLAEVLGEDMKQARELVVRNLRSVVLLNRGNRFESRDLPPEAQWVPAFGINVGDFDGDGLEDLFLAQNFFAVHPERTPQDSGRGLLLKGDGSGNFKPMPGQDSGIAIPGECRGSAVSDYDQDGRLDLVVAQNGELTRLFHNKLGRPGLRVRLKGGPGNRGGIGSVVRAKSGNSKAPAKIVSGGSGYFSQDSGVLILTSSAGKVDGVEVQWPGGKISHHAVPANASEVEITIDGSIRVVR